MGISAHTSRVVIGLAIYAGLVGLAFSVNYPGRLTPDSLDMLMRAAHPETLNNWHEPATIGFWLLFAPVLGQPASALLSQALLIFAYPAVLIERAIAKRTINVPFQVGLAAFVAALVGVTGIVVKDMVLVGLFMCLLAVLEFTRVGAKSLLIALPVVAALMIGIILIRPTNSVLIALTAVFWIVVHPIKIRTAISALFLIFIAVVASPSVIKSIDRSLFGARDARPELQLIIFDVAGISSLIHEDLFAELPGWPKDSGKLRSPWECYSPINWDTFRWGDCEEYFALVEILVDAEVRLGASIGTYGRADAAEAHAVENITASPISWWVRSILAHPIAYVIHRFDFAFHLIRSMSPIWTGPYPANTDQLFGTTANGFEMRGVFQPWKHRIVHVPFERTAAFVFSRPILLITIFVCAFVLISAWRSRRGAGAVIDLVEMEAAGIGLANFLTLTALGVSSEGRYLLPTFVCGIVIILRRLSLIRARAVQHANEWSLP